ncbi:hypothetical protein D0A37_00495 [Microcoleus vaginatus HSN003]|nr:hypothetical protein D0A37_00495 [Microcoleus vaginatus HSN003]
MNFLSFHNKTQAGFQRKSRLVRLFYRRSVKLLARRYWLDHFPQSECASATTLEEVETIPKQTLKY